MCSPSRSVSTDLCFGFFSVTVLPGDSLKLSPGVSYPQATDSFLGAAFVYSKRAVWPVLALRLSGLSSPVGLSKSPSRGRFLLIGLLQLGRVLALWSLFSSASYKDQVGLAITCSGCDRHSGSPSDKGPADSQRRPDRKKQE